MVNWKLSGPRIKSYLKGYHTKPNIWDEAAALKVYRGGELLDPGVNFFVLMFDKLGLPTTYSCEGHPGGFYVTFHGSYEEALAIKRAGFFSVEIEDENYWSIRWHMTEGNKADAMRWAAEAWQSRFGDLNFNTVKLVG